MSSLDEKSSGSEQRTARLLNNCRYRPRLMNIKKPSTDLPDEVVCIQDDIEAQAFLLGIGILDKLPSAATLAKSGSEEAHTIFVSHYTHHTHWILACRFHGMEDPKENGFLVWGWPKNRWPRSTMKDFIESQKLGEPMSQKTFRKGEAPLS